MMGVAIFFIVLGVLIKYGKMYFLIAGYNTMSKEEQAKYNIAGVATVFRNGMCGMGVVILGGYFLADYTEQPKIENYAFWTAMILGIPYILLMSNSNKFKKKD